MPELPEVEIMRRGVAAVAGCTVRSFRQPRLRVRPIEISPSPNSFRRRVIGQSIVAVERLGKRVVFELNTSERIVIEPRMSGLILLANPPDVEHLRAVFELSGREKQLLFWDRRGLGVMRLVTPTEFETLYGRKTIGPDALQISAAELRDRLGDSCRAIKVVLLDQRAVAGIGNIYASEILHRVGIHPTERCKHLQPKQWSDLHFQIASVLREAIRRQGSTLRDNTFRLASGGQGKYPFRVYDRAGQQCLNCGQGEILRIVQVQRCTFSVPCVSVLGRNGKIVYRVSRGARQRCHFHECRKERAVGRRRALCNSKRSSHIWQHRWAEYPLPESELLCGCCGTQRVVTRTLVTERVEMEEGKLYVVEEVLVQPLHLFVHTALHWNSLPPLNLPNMRRVVLKYRTAPPNSPAPMASPKPSAIDPAWA